MTAPGTFETCLPALTCQFIKLMRTMRLGAQVVKINADLLHFQPAPSASESSIGGVDLIGAKVAAQASVRNAIMSKDLFIAVLPFPVCQRCVFPTWRLLNQHCYRALVSACLRGQGKWLRPTEQIVSWPPAQRNLFTRSRPQSGMLTGEICDSPAPGTARRKKERKHSATPSGPCGWAAPARGHRCQCSDRLLVRAAASRFQP